MSESLFSASWYRVAGMRPRLRSHAVVHRHLYRGRVWYVMQDRSSGRFHRFSPNAYFVIGLMDGRRTLQQIWDAACERLGDDAPTQEEVINLLSMLHRGDVLQSDIAPDQNELQQRNVQQERLRLKQYIQNPLALRIPLVDPERLLEWMKPAAQVLFGPLGAVLWLVVVGWAVVLAGMHWSDLSANVADRLLSAQNLLLIGLVFPVTKALHELGHAAAVKARGGEVHEMGVMLLVLMPIPYVDASASLAFREKRERIVVGAAGMMTELFVAALAMFVWVSVEPGVVRALAYNVMLIAGISTVVFNANPLLRFDGYYILADVLEIANLGQRANAHLGYLVSRYLFGVKTAVARGATPGERRWFVFYAIASFAYRMIVMVSIALLVAERYFVIGVLLSLWAVYSMLLQPLAKKVAWLFTTSELHARRTRALTLVGLTVGAVAATLLWVPAPAWTRADGVTVAPIDSHVRASADGFVREVLARPGQVVEPGDALIVAEDPELVARSRVLEAQLNEYRARFAAAHEDRVQRDILREEIAHLESRLELARKRVAELTVRSPARGIFVMEQPEDAPGRFVQRGELLAYVMDYSQVAVQVVVPQGEVDLIRQLTQRVELRRVERIAEVLTAKVKRVVPAATDQLPSPALSAQGGGDIVVDPQAKAAGRPGELKALSTLFVFELEFAGGAPLRALGSRIYARFELQPEPLGRQWYRVVRRIFLKRLNV